MDQFIARQPILNVHKKLFAYELLYRGAKHYALDKVSGNRATASVLSSVFLTKDIKDISGFRPCFINFPQKLIEEMLPASFPKSQIVVEILEDVQPTEKVISACQRLHEDGYTIALDDFVYHRQLEPLIELADIIKIDIRMTPLDTIMRTLNLLSRHKVKLLAEKVETLDEFEKANKLGFTYYQGYFFCKPEHIKIKELSANKASLLALLAEVTKKTTTIEKLHKIINTDLAITYKLMKFLNSAYFYRLQEVKTVKHAIAYLGEKELRRFIMLMIVSELAVKKPGELVRLVLVRAKFCELLGLASPLPCDASELFMMGLFSLLDTMLNRPMKDIMEHLPVSKNIKDALLLKTGHYTTFLKIPIAFERNQDAVFTRLLAELGIDPDRAGKCYLVAIRYANGLM
ncbi:MAG: EAL domain-containing protein [Proteobacteria bacterium]|nr:EAL domain-containing protein [Pseudomonadota bacterium]MBU1058261.1 EAL domain-containing protein [Pseudomonadota bacterium]